MDYFFEDDNNITFLIWSDRPNFDTRPFPINYAWVQLTGLTWDFKYNVFTESSITEQQPMQKPYLEDYPVEVVGVSPNNEWQLLQITEAPEAYQGFWLVNKKTVTQIVPYVPSSIKWQWSNDSEMLWLIHTIHDISGDSYAIQSVVVDLAGTDAPQTVFNSWDTDMSPNLLSPTEPEPYELVFSPAHKTVLSYKNIEVDEALLNQPLTVYSLDVSQNPPQQIEVFEVTPPFFIDWNDTLQDFVIIELSETGGEIYTLDRSFVYKIPIEIIKQMPNLLGENDQGRTDANVAAYLNANLKGIGISPDLHHVVLMMRNKAWAFSCDECPLPRHFSRGLASYSCATGTGVSHFSYDATNMINRIESTVTYDPQEFDAQNRLISVNRVGTGTTTFAYDAAGIRVKTVHPGGKTSYFPFPGYEEEVNGSTTTRRITYAIAGQTVALRVQVVGTGGSNILYYLHSDHLGSTSLATTTTGALVGNTTARYLPFGGFRTTPTAGLTDIGFTGHRHNNLPGSDLGLVYMNARFFVPSIGRFASADTIVPNPTNPQSYNRYSYVGGGQFSSPRDAYLSVYGGSVTFYKTGTGSSAGAMGEAKSKNLIHVYHHSTAITSASAGTFWVAHELGHAFNYALVPNQTEPNYNHGQGVIDLAQKGVRVNGALISGATSSTSWLGNYTRGDFEGYQNSSPPHIQNPAYSASEDFADMFSNYVHNSFAVGNAGQARYDFMANHMSSWIALAVSNNE
jgi:RHS repeat-associated protein